MLKNKRALVAVVSIMMLFTLVSIPEEAEAGAGMMNLVVTRIDSSAEKVIYTRPGQPSSTFFEFSVGVQGTFVGFAKLQIDPGPAVDGFTFDVSTRYISLKANTNATVTAYATASAIITAPTEFSVQIQVTILQQGNYGVGPGQRMSASGRVKIIQYSMVSLSSPHPYQQVTPGTEAPYTFDVMNLGNGQEDLIDFKVDNKADLEAKGWTIIEPPLKKVYSLAGGTSIEQVSVFTRTPRGTIIKYRDELEPLTLTAWSQTARDSRGTISDIPTSYSVTTYVKGFYIPGYEFTFAISAMGIVFLMYARKQNMLK